MKTVLVSALLSLLTLTAVQAQSQTEKTSKTGSFQNTQNVRVLSLANISGFVKIEGYNGNQVMLESEKTVTAKNQAEVTKGMQEVQLKLLEAGDSIYVYLEAPFIKRSKHRGHGLNMNTEDINYDFKYDLTLKVPFKIDLDVSTVNDGDVTVANLTGNLKVRNVNGGVFLTNITGSTQATTVNGPVEVSFAQAPAADSQFKTINGELKVFYPAKLDATVSFKSMNGQFYTDLKDLELQPVKVTRNTGNNGSNTVYKLDKSQTYKAGQGGIALTFETLNGNIYLKKK
jgi:hypothetical protein